MWCASRRSDKLFTGLDACSVASFGPCISLASRNRAAQRSHFADHHDLSAKPDDGFQWSFPYAMELCEVRSCQ
ncbi:hypothetical protein AAHC03_013332 [Spirometra sp. Aus1]